MLKLRRLTLSKTRSSLCIPIALIIAGCAGAPKMDQALTFTKAGLYTEAEQEVMKNIEPNGRNRLLHNLEMGMINHLKGDYTRSNHYFDEAERLGEEFYTASITEGIAELLTGPTLSKYKGYQFENTFVNYYKTLNYLKLAEANPQQYENKLDAALVEIRKLSNRLERQKLETGGYKSDRQKELDGDESTSAKILDFLAQALGEPADADKLRYRDDAFGHYLSGLLFELGGNVDNARISYQRAATSYQNGFADQYKLGRGAILRSWYDVARVMKLDHDNEWRETAQRYLPLSQQKSLQKLSGHSSEVVVIQHTGTIPQRKQMHFKLTIDASTQSLVLWPVLVGNATERSEQMAWFQMLYADTGAIDIIQNYALGNVGTALSGIVSKRIPLGPLWDVALELHLVDALEYGVRIAVPYYPPAKNTFVSSELYVNNKKSSVLMPGDSIMRIALQEQIRTANKHIKVALTRELVKAIGAQKAAEEGPYGNLLKLANFITASADTRNWRTLPAGVKFARVNIEKGENHLELKTTLKNGQVISQKQIINAKAGKPTLWHTRTFEPVGITPMKSL